MNSRDVDIYVISKHDLNRVTMVAQVFGSLPSSSKVTIIAQDYPDERINSIKTLYPKFNFIRTNSLDSTLKSIKRNRYLAIKDAYINNSKAAFFLDDDFKLDKRMSTKFIDEIIARGLSNYSILHFKSKQFVSFKLSEDSPSDPLWHGGAVLVTNNIINLLYKYYNIIEDDIDDLLYYLIPYMEGYNIGVLTQDRIKLLTESFNNSTWNKSEKRDYSETTRLNLIQNSVYLTDNAIKIHLENQMNKDKNKYWRSIYGD